jgi:methylmalonyl-CoA decarboxylase subunit alpha
MYLGSPRMAEMVVGEVTTLEDMGGARMHCTVSGCGDALVASDEEAIAWARTYFGYFPTDYSQDPPLYDFEPPEDLSPASVLPDDEHRGYDMIEFMRGVFDEDSILEIKELYAAEVITALARLGGRRWESWPPSPTTWAGFSSSTPPTRRPGSSGCAMPSTSRSCSSPTCPAS